MDGSGLDLSYLAYEVLHLIIDRYVEVDCFQRVSTAPDNRWVAVDSFQRALSAPDNRWVVIF